MRIEILGEAQQDLIDGFRFYENQAAGLGDYPAKPREGQHSMETLLPGSQH